MTLPGGLLINIRINNTQTAWWRTNKHVNNASRRSDVPDGVKERHVYFCVGKGVLILIKVTVDNDEDKSRAVLLIILF